MAWDSEEGPTSSRQAAHAQDQTTQADDEDKRWVERWTAPANHDTSLAQGLDRVAFQSDVDESHACPLFPEP